MNFKILKNNIGIGLIFTLRMFGVFIIFPILTKYGMILKHSNTFLIGLALGSYGITQAIFQIPFSYFADKFGYKKSILIGLFLFFLGSIIGFITDSIFGIIFARLIQGSGAISSILIILLLNLNKKNKIKSMIFLGINFAITFSVSIILSPILVYRIGLKGIFIGTSLMSIINIILAYLIIPKKLHSIKKNKISIKNTFNEILKNKIILNSIFSIFFLHAILITNFISIPLLIIDSGIKIYNHWIIYLIILFISFLFSIPSLNYFMKKNKNKNLIKICISILFFSIFIFIFSNKNFYSIFIALQIFFIIFNILEFFLPITINKESKLTSKATTMGIYSTCQFLGNTFGGIISGLILKFNNINYIFFEEIIICILWLILISRSKRIY